MLANCDDYNQIFWIGKFFYLIISKLMFLVVLNVATSPNIHRMCIWSIHTYLYVKMPDVTANYRKPHDLIMYDFRRFYTKFNVAFFLFSPNFHRSCI